MCIFLLPVRVYWLLWCSLDASTEGAWGRVTSNKIRPDRYQLQNKYCISHKWFIISSEVSVVIWYETMPHLRRKRKNWQETHWLVDRPNALNTCTKVNTKTQEKHGKTSMTKWYSNPCFQQSNLSVRTVECSMRRRKICSFTQTVSAKQNNYITRQTIKL